MQGKHCTMLIAAINQTHKAKAASDSYPKYVSIHPKDREEFARQVREFYGTDCNSFEDIETLNGVQVCSSEKVKPGHVRVVSLESDA